MIISPERYAEIVKFSGGSRPFDPKLGANNFFVYFDHRIELYNYATVNDRCQAPERLYMDLEVAIAVQQYLNHMIMFS